MRSRYRQERAAPWGSESEMAAACIEEMKSLGFSVYPESCGHDIIFRLDTPVLKAWFPEVQPGDTIAVEAKLQPNLTVLRQALPPKKGPAADFYAVLVPKAGSDFREVARALEVAVWELPRGGRHHGGFHTRERCVGLPPLVLPLSVDMPAGCPAPRSVTTWKLDAVRLCVKGRRNYLSTQDFQATVVRPRTFLDRGWAQHSYREGRTNFYELLESEGRPDVVYPEITAAVLLERDRAEEKRRV